MMDYGTMQLLIVIVFSLLYNAQTVEQTPRMRRDVKSKMEKCPAKCECSSSNMLAIYCGTGADFEHLTHLPAFFPSKVEFLSLSSNVLETIPANVFWNLTHLQNLNLARNRLRELPVNVFRDLRSLTSLHLARNMLTSLPARIFQGLGSLEELRLSHNLLENLPDALLDDLKSLKRLFLNGNRLKAVPERAFGRTIALRGLFLDNNGLTEIAGNAFENITSLSILSLSNNKIASIQSRMFRRLCTSSRGRCQLRLDKNQLASIPRDAFASLSASTMVALQGNPFHCDCRLAWLKQWVSRSRIIYSRQDIKCSRPRHLQGQSLLGVPVNEFTCRNGQWSEWSDWSPCSRTCGRGEQISNRSCTNPPPEGGTSCEGDATRWQVCQRPACPVEGQWTSWSEWTKCSASCSGGTQRRRRHCQHPEHVAGAIQCSGEPTESRDCSLAPCPIDGDWAEWSGWSGCSATCQGGMKTRNRSCTNPKPQYGGRACAGSPNMTQFCYLGPCPTDGGWSSWTNWSLCSKSCSNGTKLRSRTCDNPSPSNGGKECTGSAKEVIHCNLGPCPVHGGWSSWTNWTSCSKTCSTGTKSRHRTCSNPTPNFMGLTCPGKSFELMNCSLRPCPVNGAWTSWTNWSECSSACSSGNRVRSRTCRNPKPQYGGHYCRGHSKEEEPCSSGPCLKNGIWGPWTSWGSCSHTCGNGTRQRIRQCGPEPNNGQDCVGVSREVEPCNPAVCPVHGAWRSWTEWTDCTKTCDGGTQLRTRTCENPSPSENGNSCSGIQKEERVCNIEPCSQWSVWSNWTTCSVTCGTGTQSRFRSCSQARGAVLKMSCRGEYSQVKVCHENECAGPDGWTDWTDWTPCFSLSSCDGVQTRRRACLRHTLPNAQLGCSGKDYEVRNCKALHNCKHVRPSWSPWSSWSDCHPPKVSNCGPGSQVRWRLCRSESGLPHHGNCSGSQGSLVQLQRQSCRTPCNYTGVWIPWSTWGSCSKSCGSGMRSRRRTCISLAIGLKCKGKDNQKELCAIQPCPTHPAIINLEDPPTCPDPGTSFNSDRKLIDQSGSYYVMYTCKKHFALKGPRLRHCEANGQWSDSLPTCVPICGKSKFRQSELEHKRLRIFGGSPSAPGSWPWQAMLEFKEFHCGGTLIGEQWIVTAAHCVVYKGSNLTFPEITVHLGVHDITRKDKNPNVQTIPGDRIFHYPNFNWKTYDSDVALIRLRHKVNITDYVRPVCLPNHQQRQMVKPGTKGVLLGWGMTESNGYTARLREVHMPVVKHSTCKKAYKDDTWPVTSNMLCAGDKTNTDSCFKDSGGPFLFFDKREKKRKWFLGGVISWGNPKCGTPGKYSVFTRLNKAFTSWIKHTMDWEYNK